MGQRNQTIEVDSSNIIFCQQDNMVAWELSHLSYLIYLQTVDFL